MRSIKVIFLVIVLFMGACKNARETPVIVDPIVIESNFHYDESGKIVLACQIQDSIPVSLIFDTGGGGQMIFEKSFADSLLNYKDKPSEIRYIRNGWDFSVEYPIIVVKDSIAIDLGGKKIEFREYQIIDGASFNFRDAKGLISIPRGDDRIWEINYEDKQINILESYIPDEKDIILNMKKSSTMDSSYVIENFPFELVQNDTTLTSLQDLLIDTGKGRDGAIAFHLVDISDDFIKIIDDSSTVKFVERGSVGSDMSKEWYYIYIGGIISDSLWIEHSYRKRPYNIVGELRTTIAGNNFLKRFNIRMDLKRMQIYLAPIKFVDIVSELGKIISFIRDEDGAYVLIYISDEFFLSMGGFEIGDIFETVNDMHIASLSRDYFDNISVGDTITVVFTRRDQKMAKKVIKPKI